MSTSLTQRTLVSIIIPTLDEAANIDKLLSLILREYDDGHPVEVLVADGGSRDGTIEIVRSWETESPVRLIASDGRRGLAGDVLAAARCATGDVIVIMDADLSHPPERIRDLVQPIVDGTSDMVVGSRYVRNGATPGWPWLRRMMSRAGSLLAWPLTELKDPMSGFFAVRRERLLAVDPSAAGFKIGLEIIAEAGGALRLTEVPIIFRERVGGKSKIGWRQLAIFFRRVLALAGGSVSLANAARFACVGLIGIFVDFLIFEGMFAFGTNLVVAHVTSFVLATISNFLLNSRWTFAEARATRRDRDWLRYSRFLAVSLLALALRGGLLAASIVFLQWPPQIAIFPAIGIAAVINFLGNAFFVFPSLHPRVPVDIRWRVAAIGIFGYVLALRLIYMGLVDLIPEEAYYWNYAQHLDIGYLDHPPMVAWLIRGGTSLFGNTEFGVRIAAFITWLVTAVFTFKSTNAAFGKSAAFFSILLVASLPFFFSSGIVMTPDAPLTAAWAGALYFLGRSLLDGKRLAWLGVGVCLGLGMLSKYTIALLGPATLVFLLIDPQARAWLRRPQPYLAAAIAALLFAPVVKWNAAHDWASFAFQSSRRLSDSIRFSFPELIGAAALLLTPFGLYFAIYSLVRSFKLRATTPIYLDKIGRLRFAAVYSIVPLSVFVVFSLFHRIKLDWTGPIWLALLPVISATIIAIGNEKRYGQSARRLWVLTIASTVAFLGLCLHYFVLGVSVTGYALSLETFPVAWQEFGREAGLVARSVEADTGRQPLLAGMDTYFLASEIAFYDRESPDSVQRSVGRGALGRNSLMYGYWFDANNMIGKDLILFALQRDQLLEKDLEKRFDRIGDVDKRDVIKAGKVVGQFFYRVGYELKPDH
jgi:dolichol-phosphate mannosyltransferase